PEDHLFLERRHEAVRRVNQHFVACARLPREHVADRGELGAELDPVGAVSPLAVRAQGKTNRIARRRRQAMKYTSRDVDETHVIAPAMNPDLPLKRYLPSGDGGGKCRPTHEMPKE